MKFYHAALDGTSGHHYWANPVSAATNMISTITSLVYSVHSHVHSRYILTNSQLHRMYYAHVLDCIKLIYNPRTVYATYVRLNIGKGNVLQILFCAVGFSQLKRTQHFTVSSELWNTLSFTLLLAQFKKRGDTFSPPKGGGARTDLLR